jgi:hypothetical protein
LGTDNSAAAVAARLATSTTSNMSDWVIGAIEGAVTTFAIAAGAIGASPSCAYRQGVRHPDRRRDEDRTSHLVEGDLVTVVAQRDKVYSASTA